MKVDGSINPLVQGVSQQPAKIRLPGQCTRQENLSSDPVDGLKRRPPSEYIASLFTETTGVQFLDFNISGEAYVLALESGSVRVFDTLGVERTVTIAAGAEVYFDTSKFVATYADDGTYLVNTAKTVAMQSATKSYIHTGNSLVYLLGGQYGRSYTIRLQWGANDVSVSYATPNGGAAADSLKIATDYIITQLETALNADATIAPDFTIARESDVLYIKNDAGDPVETTVSDGDGGANIFAVDYEVTDESNVPRYAPKGFIVKIVGDSSDGSDDWYVEFVTDDTSIALGAGFGNAGKWVETVGPDIEYLLDTSTMPHTLIQDGSGNFDVDFGLWEGRQVGDTNSNADPSFIGKVINDIGLFQGRLVFVAGKRVIMSRTNKHLDFWVQSATTSTATDPIDIESTAKDVSTNMLRIIPHNRDLVIFSEDAQFVVFGRNTLTPDNSALVLTTAFKANLSASPISAGKNILFAIDYGTNTGMREFFTEGAEDIDNSEPITQHVSKYMKGSITRLAGTSNFNLLLAQTTGDTENIYAYEYLWKDRTLVQSSWSTWVFSGPVEHIFFVNNVVYLVQVINNRYVLVKLDLDIAEDTGLSYQVKLDYKVPVNSVTTTVTNPLHGLVSPEDLVIIQGAGCPAPGLRVLMESYTSSTITLKQDMLGGSVFVGLPYMSIYTPTRPFVKDREGQAIDVINFKVRDYTINFKDLGYVKCNKTSAHRDTISHAFYGKRAADPLTPLGSVSVTAGSFRFPFGDDPTHAELEIVSDSHLPMNILDIGWTGQYNKLGRRIGG